MVEVTEQETSDPEDAEEEEEEEEEEEMVSQVEEPTQWVTATTRYGRSSRLPSSFQQ